MADSDRNTGLLLALVGAGAALAWWLWRSRGSRQSGSERIHAPEPAPRIVIEILGGDVVRVDGVEMNLAAAVERARHATLVEIRTRGDARHGWIEAVQAALLAAGVHFIM
jgi:hypothetical protein